MALLFHIFLLTFSQCSVFGHDAVDTQVLLARLDALEQTVERQRQQIRSQQENIQIIEIKDEQKQKRIEELENIVQVQQDAINDVISRAKEENSLEKVSDVTQEATKNVLGTGTKSFDESKQRPTGCCSKRNAEEVKTSLRHLNGRRQTPEAVAFHASIDVLTHVTQLINGQTVIFDSVHLNIGGGYHSSAGLFIAPTPGVYLFSLSVMLNTGATKWIDLDLIKNGQVISGAYAYQYDQGSVSIVTELKIGDEVLVKVHGSNIGMVYGEKLTSFMGTLLTHL